MSEPILVATQEGPAIAIVTLNRPQKRNALSLELIEAITAAVLRLNAEPGRRAIILCGAGPVFCAGLDLAEAQSPAGAEASAEALSRMYAVIGNSPLITIAAAQGAAMGGGAGILAACDFVVAADDLKIAYPEVRRGLVAALVTCLLRRQLNDRGVRELILLGQPIEAARALELGLISKIASMENLVATAMELACLSCEGAPGAIARSKRLLDALAARPLVEDLQIALGFHMTARNSAEAAEGIAAFKEHRAPNWG